MKSNNTNQLYKFLYEHILSIVVVSIALFILGYPIHLAAPIAIILLNVAKLLFNRKQFLIESRNKIRNYIDDLKFSIKK